jgi:hypothetical protein
MSHVWLFCQLSARLALGGGNEGGEAFKVINKTALH